MGINEKIKIYVAIVTDNKSNNQVIDKKGFRTVPEARQFVYDWFDTNKNGYEIIGVEWDGECFETPNGAYAYIEDADYTTYCEVISVEC